MLWICDDDVEDRVQSIGLQSWIINWNFITERTLILTRTIDFWNLFHGRGTLCIRWKWIWWAFSIEVVDQLVRFIFIVDQ